jgi:16S rRNA (adenine1518-N6/adenine1519-N6)-dimethyltransferase
VIAGDALAVPMPLAGVEPTALVANLPYNVAVPIVLRLLSELPTVRHGLVMVQLEVAQRLAAGPGSRVYGVPSVKMQWFGSVESAGTVGPNVFWPAPRVDSGLVRFTRHPAPECASSRAEVFACIDAGFSQRRKKLRSALAGWAGGVSAADEILERASVDSAARGEDLTLSSFVRIADARREVTPA